MSTAFLNILAGDEEAYATQRKEYRDTLDQLFRKAEDYGLPWLPEDLSEEQQDILKDTDV